MISFRFHIVSLAAVFMALALGVVLGTAFINDGIVDSLETRIETLTAERDVRRAELSDWERFGDHAEAAIVEGRLAGVRVLTIVPEDLADAEANKFRSLLATAGAVDAGTVTLDSSWADDPAPTAEIAAALGIVGPSSIESVADEAADRLAREFAAGGGPTLGALVEANLARLDAGDPATTPGGSARYVVIDDIAPEGLVEPLARALATQIPRSVLVVDTEPDEEGGDSLVGVMRRDAEGALFSTVDDLHTARGRVAAIFALADFGRGVTGDYGSDESADRAAPSGG